MAERLQEEQEWIELAAMELEIQQMEQQRSVCTKNVRKLQKQKDKIPIPSEKAPDNNWRELAGLERGFDNIDGDIDQ